MSSSRFGSFSRSPLAALLFASSIAACDKPQPQTTPDSSSAKASGPQSPAVGGKMNEVAKSLGKGSTSSDELAKQPPVTGIFAEGVADKAHAPNAPPKLEMIKDGSEPRIKLHAGPIEPQMFALKLEIGQGQGRPMLSRVVFVEVAPPELSGKVLEALAKQEKEAEDEEAPPAGSGSAKPKTPPPKASASPSSAPAASAAPSASPSAPAPASVPLAPVTATSGPKLVATVLGRSGLNDDFNGTITFTLTSAGATDIVHKFNKDIADPGKAKNREFEMSVVEDMLFALYSGVPDKPVGEGAQWTVEERRKSLGTDVVRYRLFEVAGIEGDTAKVSMMIRQYAATETSEIVNDPNLIMRQYDFVTEEGGVLLAPKGFFPRAGGFSFHLMNNIVPKTAKADPSVRGEQVALEGTAQIFEAALKPPGEDEKKDPKAPDDKKDKDKGKGKPDKTKADAPKGDKPKAEKPKPEK